MAGICRKTLPSYRRYNHPVLVGMKEDFIKAFVEVLREEVACKNKIILDGVGTFKFYHRRQFQKQFEDGRVVMMPPKDTVTFIPENQLDDDC